MRDLILFITMLLLVLVGAVPAYSALTFTDGEWATDFHLGGVCEETTAPVESTVGFSWPDAADCGGFIASWLTNRSDHPCSIETVANRPGSQGNGARFWNFTGSDNSSCGKLHGNFPAPIQELWLRFYKKYSATYPYTSVYDKWVYFSTGGAMNASTIIDLTYSELFVNVNKQPGVPLPIQKTGLSDANFDYHIWHEYEIHLKMDTATAPDVPSNGIIELWVDGVQYIDYRTVNFSDGLAVRKLGWTTYEFDANQKEIASDDYVDYDDFAISTNGRIGSSAHVGPVVTVTAPLTEEPVDTTSTSLEITTDEANSGVICKYESEDTATSSTAYADLDNTFSESGTYGYNATISSLTNGYDKDHFIRCAGAETNDTSTIANISVAAAADTTPPEVDSVTPLNTATGVLLNTSVTATFDETIDCATAAITVKADGTEDDTVLDITCNPAGAISATTTGQIVGTLYEANIPTSVTDTAGNGLLSAKVWSYTTYASECDATHYGLCFNQTDCEAESFYWHSDTEHDDGGVCRTVPIFTDITGENLVKDRSLDEWSNGYLDAYNNVGDTSQIIQMPSGVRLYNGGTLNQNIPLVVGTEYRFAVNILDLTESPFELYHRDVQELSTGTTPYTFTGTFIHNDEADNKLYWKANTLDDVTVDDFGLWKVLIKSTKSTASGTMSLQ